MNEEAQPQDELQVVGYTTEADGVRYTANSIESVNDWKGQAAGDVVPVVLKSEADAKIKELSDLVISLSETQAENIDLGDIFAALERMPARIIGDVLEVEPLGDVPGNDEVVQTVLNKVAKEGLKDFPVRAEIVFLPDELDQNTKELISIFGMSLAIKLLKAKKKYGYTDGWRNTDWYNDCLHEFKEHVEKGDPRDVAAFAMFMWYHGWSTNGNSPQTS